MHALSVGERQRVEIIRCLMTDPKLLILDEPTSVLPPQAVEKLFDTLRRLRDGGVSILFISHKLEEIRAICDQATILRGGRVTGNVDPREHDAHDLARMMIGRDMPALMPALATVRRGKAAGDHRVGLHARRSLRGAALRHQPRRCVPEKSSGSPVFRATARRELAALISGETMLGRDQRDRIYMMGMDVGRLDAAARRGRSDSPSCPEDRLGRGAVPEMSLVLNSLLTAHPLKLLRARARRQGAGDWRSPRNASVSMMSARPARMPRPALYPAAICRNSSSAARSCCRPNCFSWRSRPGASISAPHPPSAAGWSHCATQGMAILVISEELEELFELCDSIQVLHHGRSARRSSTRDTKPEEIGRYMIGAQASPEKVPA